MENKTRRILSRMGAAFMLGMSMFNFGAIWTRQQAEQVPKRAKNVREKSMESVDQSTKEIATIAEKHGNAVILFEQSAQVEQITGKESQQQLETKDSTVFQQIMRYAVIAVWTISLGIIFSSVLLDYPISFGKGILSTVPVFSQKTVVSLEPWSSFFQANEEVKIDIYIKSEMEKVETIALAIEFEPQLLAFEGLDRSEFFENIDIKNIDDRAGVVRLVFESGRTDVNFSARQKIARLKFSSLGEAGARKVSIVEENSSVAVIAIQEKEMQTVNSLNRVVNAQFSVLSESGGKLRCGKLTENLLQEKITVENWKNVLLETSLPKDALIWTDMGKDNFFLCAADSQGKIHFLLRKKGELKKAELFLGNKKKEYIQKENWQEDGYEFFSISFALEDDTKTKEMIDEVMLRVNGNLSWPKKGSAELWLE